MPWVRCVAAGRLRDVFMGTLQTTPLHPQEEGTAMKKLLFTVVMFGLSCVSFITHAETDDAQAERLMKAMQATAQQDQEDSSIKIAELNLEFNRKVVAITRNSVGPQSRDAFKRAVEAWMAYQKAMSEAVEISYTEGGGHGGAAAATHCNIMTGEDFLKTLKQFFYGGK